jgi:hypothetical protein
VRAAGLIDRTAASVSSRAGTRKRGACQDEEEADDDNDSDAESELSSGSSHAEWDSDFELPADKLSMRLRSIRKRTTAVSTNPADEAAASGASDEDGESAKDSDSAEANEE